MSVLYLAGDPVALADRLAENLQRQAKDGDFFVPASIVVPNRFLRKWLRLYLARRHGVAINLDFHYLENALWRLLQAVDPGAKAAPPTEIDENVYRLMVLSVLLESGAGELAPLKRYLQMERGPISRLSCRRAWDLADRIGLLLRDYEYARQDALIQRWLRHEPALSGGSGFQQIMERAQRTIFLDIIREPDGKRALLNRASDGNFKTFPQYAMERMTAPEPPPTGRTVHFFGFTQVCELHARTIAWLGRCFDVRFYHLNVLASRVGAIDPSADPAEVARKVHAELESAGIGCGELVRQWGKAGEEALGLVAPLAAGGFAVERLAEPAAAGADSVLGRLQGQLLGQPIAKARLPQDASLQIIACPGVMREVETLYGSILANLQADPKLQQTDIAVLVTDMGRYRSALQAVLERPPRRLQYNLVDYSAAGASMFGQALLGMLDLALETFSRGRVFEVLLNPCFLARLGIDRSTAMTWLGWAESLGICQGWDAEEKAEQGYPRSPLYAWRLGLERLRLGRYMDLSEDDAPSTPLGGGEGGNGATRFGDVIPYADLESADREQLDAFCRAVEGLLPTLANLRKGKFSGQRWARMLGQLVQEFLDVPADRPEEGQVRANLLAGLDALSQWDSLHESEGRGTRRDAALPLALVREFVRSQLEIMPASHGEYLIGGVTISALQPMRPLPFAIVYVLGLSENLFPGSNALSSFDLRGTERMPGDIRPAEARLYDFLATILSARRKLYLLYNARDLQKDQEILPAVPLQQLQRSLSMHVLQEEFKVVQMPMQADDPAFIDPARQPAYQDVLVQFHAAERCLSVQAARRDHRLILSKRQEAEWQREWSRLQRQFAIVADHADPLSRPNVALAELRRFLRLPAHASLRRHLRIEEDEEQALDDHEPLVTPQEVANRLARDAISRLVREAGEGRLEQALADWPARFAQAYADARLCSQVPEAAFGDIDQAALANDLHERIHGQGNIAEFLRAHAGMEFCGPLLLGESLTPLRPKLRFPALRLRAGQELDADGPAEIRLSGWTHFAWQARGRFEILVVTNSKEIDGRYVCEAMFEPMLLYFALLAGVEPNQAGVISQTWLGRREFVLSVGHRGGIQQWRYPAGDITAAEALRYLVDLTRDFLDPASFDLLPFEALARNRTLRLATLEDAAGLMGAETFCTMLSEYLADQRESARPAVKIPMLVEMAQARVPADALVKVRRRFPLLDRGPARVRRQPKVFARKPARMAAP